MEIFDHQRFGYISFGTAQTGTTYIPNFSSAGNYYVVCVSTYPGSLHVISNEVEIDVVGNSISPSASQSILINTNGTRLNVTESPAGTSREWKYSSTSGSGYASFMTPETGTSYTPNFSASGNYYIVCQSVINGIATQSNEVLISVSSVTLSTGTISGSPFAMSTHTPSIAVSVPYAVSNLFNSGNTFTAQLSDANGSFASATDIGTNTSTQAGSISASIPAGTPAGTAYRIRVVADNPAVIGTDNGTDLTIDWFHNSIAPGASQSILYNTNGTALSVGESQTATREWVYSTTSGSGYQSFNPTESGTTYTPYFSLPGTYYVVCRSVNSYSDTATSNEVEIAVNNGSVINTSAINGSPFEISPSAHVQLQVGFTSDAVFYSGNIFQAQLSDNNGNFSAPTIIGTLNDSVVGAISATIPNNLASGTNYRIRVVSSNPPIIGSDNGVALNIVPFEITVSPTDTQWIDVGVDGTTITASATQAGSYRWMYSEISGLAYTDFTPAETNATYTPKFNTAKPYYIICQATNNLNDVVTSQEMVVIVQNPNNVTTVENRGVVYTHHHQLVIDLRQSGMAHPVLEVSNLMGQIVMKQSLSAHALNMPATRLTDGVYVFRLIDGQEINSGKLIVR